MAGVVKHQKMLDSDAHIGQVGGDGDNISETPAITAGAYSAGDQVGGMLEFQNAARVANGSGMLTDVMIVDDAGQEATLELWLFSETATASDAGDNAVAAITEGDAENLVAIINLTSYFDGGVPHVAQQELTKRYECTGDQASLFGILITRGTPTYAATDDLTIKIKVLQD